MAEFDFNNNDVFGGIKFEDGENNLGTNSNECSSFFSFAVEFHRFRI